MLRPAERRVADYVLASPGDAVVASIGELARRCQTSPATVSKFCRALGYANLATLRRSLAADLAGTRLAWDQILTVLGDVPQPALEACRSILLGIYNTFRIFDRAAVEAAVERIDRARHVLLVGSGGSGIVASFIAQKFLRLGVATVAMSDPSTCRDHLALATPDDVLIAISHRGETAYVVDAVRDARQRGVYAIAVTQRPGSPVAMAADIRLLTSAEEPLWPGDSTRGRLAAMALFDALHALLVAVRAATERTAAIDNEATARRVSDE
ncbi:MAG: MurR/RpiR family transcriptional regulator [Chloroflexi bacterium]|nr:MurR/RpiR family transcriptional regulator [Chloroflexota bacterium]